MTDRLTARSRRLVDHLATAGPSYERDLVVALRAPARVVRAQLQHLLTSGHVIVAGHGLTLAGREVPRYAIGPADDLARLRQGLRRVNDQLAANEAGQQALRHEQDLPNKPSSVQVERLREEARAEAESLMQRKWHLQAEVSRAERQMTAVAS
jgi:hypothetical protein